MVIQVLETLLSVEPLDSQRFSVLSACFLAHLTPCLTDLGLWKPQNSQHAHSAQLLSKFASAKPQAQRCLRQSQGLLA